MKFSLGFSPCPNDTFIFYALLHGKVKVKDFEFDPVIEDVEQLNQRAFQSELEITKISFNAFLDLTEDYILLESGAALGRNCGPLLISNRTLAISELAGKTIAIPGEKTTANFLLDFYLPEGTTIKKKICLFSDIEKVLLNGEADAGVIIHENRFTYADKGLKLVQDLGEYWEETTGNPIPLGGIIARRNLGLAQLSMISKAIQTSIQYAWANPDETLRYVRQYAQEMEESVMKQHIDLYVNDFSLSLGLTGRKAVTNFFTAAIHQHRIEMMPASPIFLPR
ncbi:MAG: 1,4-dihydroxy-6-naphthoate synthase [Saprospiraceae bacterium]|nr:1,4-dihydroxy-6-naphthoate synthase [Saprospiraceae bacterium]